jgi:hypothetical protein
MNFLVEISKLFPALSNSSASKGMSNLLELYPARSAFSIKATIFSAISLKVGAFATSSFLTP